MNELKEAVRVINLMHCYFTVINYFNFIINHSLKRNRIDHSCTNEQAIFFPPEFNSAKNYKLHFKIYKVLNYIASIMSKIINLNGNSFVFSACFICCSFQISLKDVNIGYFKIDCRNIAM